MVVSASRGGGRRPLLFPFVQALKQNHNKKQSWTDGFVPESSSVSPQDDNDTEEEEDDEDDDNIIQTVLPHVHSLLQVPCALQVPDSHRDITPVTAIIDTGAQVTVLSAESAQQCGVSHLLDRRYAGQATGVGSCRVLGRIPAGALLLHLSHTIIPSPAITVLDNNSMGMDLLLGLDFLRDTGAILNMKDEEMILQQEGKIVIPFVRPKMETETTGGWIPKDVIKTLETRCVDSYEECSDDDNDNDSDLDMSGV